MLRDRTAASWLAHVEDELVGNWTGWTTPGHLGAVVAAQLRLPHARHRCARRPAAHRFPTLVVTADGNGLGSPETVRAWQNAIPGSGLMVVPGDSYRVAASDPNLCAQAALAFIDRRCAI